MKPLITALYLFAAESLYWHVPGRYDFHFFVAAICLLWWIMEVDMKKKQIKKVVGGFYEVVKQDCASIGSIVVLTRDDGSDIPWFRIVSGETKFDRENVALWMDSLRRLTGDDLKRQGLAHVEKKHPRWIDRARAEARIIANSQGRVSSNDLQLMIARGTLEPPPHCNAMGAVFRKGFIRIGIEEAKSPQAHNRGGGVSVWAAK